MSKRNFSFIHPDSLTTILNDVVEKYALKASDIRKLSAKEEIKVILLDQSIGDYLHGIPTGTVLSIKEYLEENHLAKYVQSSTGSLTGTMYLYSVNRTWDNWAWEINVTKYNSDLYWSPFDDRCINCNRSKSEFLEQFVSSTDVPGETKVGWRGPAILYEDIEKMPETFTHYDTCKDDYFIIRNRDLSEFSTLNSLTNRQSS